MVRLISSETWRLVGRHGNQTEFALHLLPGEILAPVTFRIFTLFCAAGRMMESEAPHPTPVRFRGGRQAAGVEEALRLADRLLIERCNRLYKRIDDV